MNSNKLVWIFAGLSTILLVLSVILLVQIDRTDPEILFEDINLIYSPDVDVSNLYQGVTAYDDKDGDLTDKIVIEKIVSSPDSKSVSVTYAVLDSSNNFSKKVRVFEQENHEESASAVLGAFVEENNHIEDTKESNELENINENGEDTETEEESSEEEGLPEEENQEDDSIEDDPTEDENENGTASQAGSRQETQVGEAPILELSKKEVTVKVGIRPAWVEVIKILTDDKDDYDVLFRNLVLGGEYDDSKIGDYEVTLRTTDSDNNRSETSNITIHVVE